MRSRGLLGRKQNAPPSRASRVALTGGLVAPMLTLALASTAAASGSTQGPMQPTAAGAGRPNILLIVTDDQRADAMATLRATSRWFAAGTRFPNAYVTTPLCTPSRATIFSGRYAHNHNQLVNASPLKLDLRYTMQRYLQDAGYQTGIVGKYLNAWNVNQNPPNWDQFAILKGETYTTPVFNVNGKVTRSHDYISTLEQKYATTVLNKFTSNKSKPWFFYLGTHAPHGPATPEAKYANAPLPPWHGNPAVGERDKSDKPPWIASHKSGIGAGQNIRARQLRSLYSVDDTVSALTRILQNSGEDRDTIAIFTSDQGYNWGEHGLAGPKVQPYTPTTQVPLMIRWPGHVTAGGVDKAAALNVDIAPTVLAAAKVRPPAAAPPLDGRSLLGNHQRAYWEMEYWQDKEFPQWPTYKTVRSPKYQYVQYYNSGGGVIFEEYYNLVADPWQLTNLLNDANPRNDPNLSTPRRQLASASHCKGSACP